MSNANVVTLEQPAYRVHREVTIAGLDRDRVCQELAKFFAQTPYPMGAPKPPGSLTLRFGRLSARIAMDIYHHGAFHSGEHYSVDYALGYLEGIGYFQQQHPTVVAMLREISRRGYRLNSIMRGIRDERKRYHSFNYSPPLDGKSYEHPYLSLIEHTE